MGKQAQIIQAENKNTLSKHKEIKCRSTIQSLSKINGRMSRIELKDKIIKKIKDQKKFRQSSYKQGWESKFKKFIKTKQQSYENNCTSTCQFSCPICLDMFMTPCPTSCGHMFCYRCIDQSIIRHGHCPSCRKYIRNQQFIESKPFSKISQFFWSTSKEKESYLQKSKKNEEWLSKRRINIKTIKVNDLLDVKDTEHIWCKAKILNIFKSNQKMDLLIHFEGWNDIYDEVINIESQRLAPYNFFSQRDDIPKYRLSQQQDNLRSRIDYRQPNDHEAPFSSMLLAMNQGRDIINRYGYDRSRPMSIMSNMQPWRIQRGMNFRLIRRQDDQEQNQSQQLNSNISVQAQQQNQNGWNRVRPRQDQEFHEGQRQYFDVQEQNQEVEIPSSWSIPPNSSMSHDMENFVIPQASDNQISQRNQVDNEEDSARSSPSQGQSSYRMRESPNYNMLNYIVIPSNSNNVQNANNQDDNNDEDISEEANQSQDQGGSIYIRAQQQHLKNLAPEDNEQQYNDGSQRQQNPQSQLQYPISREEQVYSQCDPACDIQNQLQVIGEGERSLEQKLISHHEQSIEILDHFSEQYGRNLQNDMGQQYYHQASQHQNGDQSNSHINQPLICQCPMQSSNVRPIGTPTITRQQQNRNINSQNQRIRNLSPIHSSQSEHLSQIMFSTHKNSNSKKQ